MSRELSKKFCLKIVQDRVRHTRRILETVTNLKYGWFETCTTHLFTSVQYFCTERNEMFVVLLTNFNDMQSHILCVLCAIRNSFIIIFVVVLGFIFWIMCHSSPFVQKKLGMFWVYYYQTNVRSFVCRITIVYFIFQLSKSKHKCLQPKCVGGVKHTDHYWKDCSKWIDAKSYIAVYKTIFLVCICTPVQTKAWAECLKELTNIFQLIS